jgi:hypothetical protein
MLCPSASQATNAFQRINRFVRVFIWPMVAILVCSTAGGCAGGKQEQQQTNLRSLAAFYSQYRAEHRGNAPPNEKEFKSFILAKSGKALTERGMTVDELFTSSRDEKPFVVKYSSIKSWGRPDVVVYEQEGRDGLRHVATSVGGYEVLTEDEFLKKSSSVAIRR